MKVITGKLFKDMVLCGANTLHNNYPEIDALNVFPVPDGDTGTNMSLTIMAAAKEVSALVPARILNSFMPAATTVTGISTLFCPDFAVITAVPVSGWL